MSVKEDQIAVTTTERDQGLVLERVANTQGAVDRESIAEETLGKEDLIRGIAIEIEEIVIEEIVGLVVETKMEEAPKGLKKAALK